MDLFPRIVAWLNVPANALGKTLLAPIAVLPGWLSATILSVASGWLLLVVFKYTSPQQAIRRVRDDVKAHLLVLRLFQDSPWVTLRAQGRIFRGSFLLLLLAVVPMLVMTVPVSLFLSQLALWYQAQPLRCGEETLVTATLQEQSGVSRHQVSIEPTPAIDVVLGPVRVPSQGEIWWQIKAREAGYHRIRLTVDGRTVEKEIAVGDTFMRLSSERPPWDWKQALLHPCEPPLEPGSSVQSIAIEYPERDSWTSGTDSWVVYWLVVSLVAALCLRPLVNVHF